MQEGVGVGGCGGAHGTWRCTYHRAGYKGLVLTALDGVRPLLRLPCHNTHLIHMGVRVRVYQAVSW